MLSQKKTLSSEKHAVIAERFVGVDVVVARGIGEGMRRKLESVGIKIIITDEDGIKEAIEKFVKGTLQNVNNSSSKCSCRHHS